MAQYKAIAVGFAGDVTKEIGDPVVTDKPYANLPSWLVPDDEVTRKAHSAELEGKEADKKKKRQAQVKVAKKTTSKKKAQKKPTKGQGDVEVV